MNAILRPSEDELHAYADNQLDADRRSQVEGWLAGHPEEAARVHDWQAVSASLRTAFDSALNETVPDRLLIAARPPHPGPVRLPQRMAAALAWLVLGSVIGYALHGLKSSESSSTLALAHSAAVAHAVYVPEVRHPVEVAADQEAHLVQWLSKRLAVPLKVPQLREQGYALVGGRLLPGDAGPVAQFMYEDAAGKRLTLYIRGDTGEDAQTAFRFVQEGRVGVFYWLDGRLGYALSGESPRGHLLELAQVIYRQLNP